MMMLIAFFMSMQNSYYTEYYPEHLKNYLAVFDVFSEVERRELWDTRS